MVARPRRILPLIIIAQHFGSSSWFAGNAVAPALIDTWSLPTESLAWITNSVQLGFICGTLIFALLSIADRFSPSRLFFVCAVVSALLNIATSFAVKSILPLLIVRFLIGVCLAGIYPVGMKIAASWYPEGMGRALGYLVGALVLGTALPHLVAFSPLIQWQSVFILISVINLIGGLVVLLGVGDGPARAKSHRLQLRMISSLIKVKKLRCSAFGYFGHMWELYAVYTIAPIWFVAWGSHSSYQLNISLISFVVIAVGSLGCMIGGILSTKVGSPNVAVFTLSVSGVCCLISPIIFDQGIILVLLFWVIWGMSVAADSPQFSSLSAQNAPAGGVGTALTLINSIGFSLTVLSIQLLVMISAWIPIQYAVWLLAPGPLLGVLAMQPLLRTNAR